MQCLSTEFACWLTYFLSTIPLLRCSSATFALTGPFLRSLSGPIRLCRKRLILSSPPFHFSALNFIRRHCFGLQLFFSVGGFLISRFVLLFKNIPFTCRFPFFVYIIDRLEALCFFCVFFPFCSLILMLSICFWSGWYASCLFPRSKLFSDFPLGSLTWFETGSPCEASPHESSLVSLARRIISKIAWPIVVVSSFSFPYYPRKIIQEEHLGWEGFGLVF
jgi:hypothetical protein